MLCSNPRVSWPMRSSAGLAAYASSHPAIKRRVIHKPKRLLFLSSIHQVLQALHDDEHVVHADAHEEEGHDRVEVSPEQPEVEAGAHAGYLQGRRRRRRKTCSYPLYTKLPQKKLSSCSIFLKFEAFNISRKNYL